MIPLIDELQQFYNHQMSHEDISHLHYDALDLPDIAVHGLEFVEGLVSGLLQKDVLPLDNC